MGGGGRVARRCLSEEDGLLFWDAFTWSGIGRSRGEIDGDGEPSGGFCPRDGGGGGGGRLRRELWSKVDGLTGLNVSVGSSNGVGEERRPTGCLGLSKALLLPE
jgi:hypothetical protein